MMGQSQLSVEGTIFNDFLDGVATLVNWASNNEQLLWWLAASSLIVFFASLILVPWLIIHISADYFVKDARSRSSLHIILGPHPLAIALVRVLRNIVGIIFVVLGLLLLVLPGQGLLTIFLGVLIADFPGKRRAVNWLVAKPSIHRSINWLRRRAGKTPIDPPAHH